jgi:hypothetical protein
MKEARKGKKEYKNNRGYICVEEWVETKDGLVKVKRITDDGLGKKITENFQTDGQNEVCDDEIDEIGKERKILVNRGK